MVHPPHKRVNVNSSFGLEQRRFFRRREAAAFCGKRVQVDQDRTGRSRPEVAYSFSQPEGASLGRVF